jgi:uncharacterized protein YqfB (UPF0267 family)
MILNFSQIINKEKTLFEEKILSGQKIHSVRKDSKNRWSQGRKIHFFVGSRTKKARKFMEGKCLSTQKILILHGSYIFIDDRALSLKEMNDFAKNDGMNLIDLMEFISQCYGAAFTGKIIHWTEKKY